MSQTGHRQTDRHTDRTGQTKTNNGSIALCENVLQTVAEKEI